MSNSTWRKGYRWSLEFRKCGVSALDGSPVYDTTSGKVNQLKKDDGSFWVDSDTGFQIEKVGETYILTHPSLNESDKRVFDSFDDAANGIWEFTTINVYCDWHRLRKFQNMLSMIS